MKFYFPEKLSFLFEPHRFKVAKGGRDGAKSWSFAHALIEIAAARKVLIVCARETMKSIADSQHRLLENTIERLGMRDQYDVQKMLIQHNDTGSQFIFAGLKHNINNIKSLEGADIVWVEEAANVSADSWEKLIPTVRKQGSEIWVSFNPELDTDATWTYLVVDPPPDTVIVDMLYTDNPWPSEVLEPEREKMRINDPDRFAHVWLGHPKRELEGAIYSNELRLAESQGRITQVPCLPDVPVYTGWDLGDGDMTAIWFVQRSMGQYRVIDYYENSHQPMSHYLNVLEGKGYTYAKDFFPWDAASKMLVGSFEESMKQRGRDVLVLPRQPIAAGIDAVREMMGTSWWDLKKCATGLQRLRHYRFGEVNVQGTNGTTSTREPIHDDSSHGADAKRSIAMGFRRLAALLRKKIEPRPIERPVQRNYAPFG